MWSYEFLVEDGRPSVTFQRRKTINSRMTMRPPTSQRPTAGWLKEARPDSWSSHSPEPWQWALSHRMPVKPGEQWQRWWWWHVPPFWHRSMALSHTRAAGNTRWKGQGRQGGAINGSHGDTPAEDITRRVHRAQAVSTLSLKQSRCIREGKTEASAARMPIVRPSRCRRAKKMARFYGFMDIFSGNKGSRKILAKQKSKPTVAAMRWNEWVGNERLPAHCETRLLCRTTISSCYPVSQKHSQEEEMAWVRCLVPPLLDLPLKCK